MPSPVAQPPSATKSMAFPTSALTASARPTGELSDPSQVSEGDVMRLKGGGCFTGCLRFVLCCCICEAICCCTLEEVLCDC
ncbi:hypothetical protein JCM10212_003541 [Sporobolomyces blumeae]